MKILLATLALGACTMQQQESPTSLSQLGDTTLELVALGQINVEMKVQSGGCPTLGDDVAATFDGQPMNVTRGGYDEVSDGCYPIAFWLQPNQLGAVTTYESGSPSSDMIIADKTAQWTVSSTRLFANQFTIDDANAQVIWQDVTAITSATLSPNVPTTITGNIIHFPAGTVIDSVSAYAHPTPATCDGPNQCLVDLSGAKSFHSTPN
jgi:hypothetical protein